MTSLIGSRGTGQAGQPTWWAAWAVRSASLPLPSEHRWRYRQEFLAELHGMTPAEQLHHATGVLSRVWTLRVALNEPQRRLVQEAAKTKPWRCQLRLHRWQRLRNPEGGWYRECRGCGTQRVSSGTGGPIINAWPHRTSGDQLALGALREAAGPLRVSGWDDSDVAREHRLTTVAQSLREQGAACATAALGDPAPDHRGGLAIGPAGIHRRLTRSPVMGSMDGVDLRCWLVGVTGLEPVTSSL